MSIQPFSYRLGAWVARRGPVSWLLFIGAFLFGSILILSRFETGPSGAGKSHAVPAPDKAASEPGSEPEPRTDWQYTVKTDSMTNKIIRTACIESKNTAQFSFPYNHADDHLRLCFREKNGRLDSYLSIDAGQFLCSFEGCSVGVRVDEGAVRRLGAGETADGSTDYLFLHNANAVLTQIKKAKTLRLQPSFYQEGDVTFILNPEGFDTAQLMAAPGRR